MLQEKSLMKVAVVRMAAMIVASKGDDKQKKKYWGAKRQLHKMNSHYRWTDEDVDVMMVEAETDAENRDENYGK